MVRTEGKKPTQTLWIFCEGRTEKLYFDKLKFIERISRLKIKSFESGHKNADGITQEALDFIRLRDFQEGDIVACVFDRDSNTNEQLRNAKSIAENGHVFISFSNPCFEYWILCHYGYFPSSYEKDNLIAKLNECMGNYEKADSELYSKTKNEIHVAISNAERIKNEHFNRGNNLISKDSNPITLVFELIKTINNFKG